MAAHTELVAAHGLTSVTIGDVAGRAGVSLTTFYEGFEDLAACADAAYQRFIGVLLQRIGSALDPTLAWHDFVPAGIRAYLETLQADLVVARAMQLEMDAAGAAARARRRVALQLIADVIAARHTALREEDPSLGPLDPEAHLAIVYSLRQLACDRLDHDDAFLPALVDPMVRYVAAVVAGAAAATAPGASRGGRPVG